MNCADLTVAARWEQCVTLLVQALPALVAAFVATLIVVPIVRHIAHRTGVVDAPDKVRKLHGRTVAYLGGVGVFVGVLAGIMGGAIFAGPDLADLPPVRLSIVLGMIAITFTGLADDIWKFDARLKIAGQLVAAAALAIDDIGVNVAVGFLAPIMGGPSEAVFSTAGFTLHNADVFYWVGTALVAAFVLGGCNAANLIDGLDGLLSGVTAIMCIGLLAIAAAIVFALPPDLANPSLGESSMAGARIVLCMSLLGACLGFLCFNFNPASIFLGDAGSLLLGFLSVTIIMTFANLQPFACPYVDRAGLDGLDPSVLPSVGKAPLSALGYEGFPTLLVMCGLAMFGLPILDTCLAMIRRKRAGVSFSTADANHLHHRIKRYFGGSVRKAVLALYGLELCGVAVGLGVALQLLLVGGTLRASFAVLLGAFVLVLVLSMRGSGVSPTASARTDATAPKA
jgi:UDP-GlcNAc:undecaprenyl-phosphate/decaprenyl-phosphate GlcNAc-1-phosphate transferase